VVLLQAQGWIMDYKYGTVYIRRKMMSQHLNAPRTNTCVSNPVTVLILTGGVEYRICFQDPTCQSNQIRSLLTFGLSFLVPTSPTSGAHVPRLICNLICNHGGSNSDWNRVYSPEYIYSCGRAPII